LLIAANVLERLYRRADADRWRTPRDRFADALTSSAERAFAGRTPRAAEVDTYLAALHLEDLALACACAAGDEGAWEHFVVVQRPFLYRAADALDPGGGARELADSLYADLYEKALFRYFHGRSSLTTWLRAVLAQRHVDWIRTRGRSQPLPDDESSCALAAPSPAIEPDRDRFLTLMQAAVKRAAAALAPGDRLRLACYYAQELTLAETGRVIGEHEATVSRALARSRAAIRQAVERDLESTGMTPAEVARCFECVAEDTGPLSVHAMLEADHAPAAARSSREIVLSKRKTP
jgi:RNA polymerase sigma factor (sigma-70 family)